MGGALVSGGSTSRRRAPAVVVTAWLTALVSVLGAVLLVGLAAPALAGPGGSALGPGERLGPGEALVSASGEHTLVMQADGVLALYGVQDVPRWTADATAPGGSLVVQADGDVTLLTPDGGTAWSTGTSGTPGARLVLADDGELAVVDPAGASLWTAATAVRPSILVGPAELAPGAGLSSPDGRFSLDVLDDGDVRLVGPDGATVWSTGTDRAGDVLALQDDGNLVVRAPDGTRPWRARTAGTVGAALVLQDDGALRLLDGAQQVVWDAGTARGPQSLAAPGTLAAGAGLGSPSGRVQLLLGDDGALALRHGTQDVWASPAAGAGAVLTVDPSGVLSLVGADGTVAWTSGPAQAVTAAVVLSVEDDGALLRDGSGRELWRAAVPPELLAADDPLAVPADCADVDAPVGPDATVVTAAGIRVHACLADALERLVADAAAEGVVLGGWGWRSDEQQRALRQEHCGSSPEAVEQLPASACRPPTARPGQSRHEWGVAIDLTVDGRVVTAGSPAYAWLQAHAEDYGLVNLPGEPWHWSVDGG